MSDEQTYELDETTWYVIPEVYGPPIPARACLPLVGWMCDYRGHYGGNPCRRIVMEGNPQQPGMGRWPDALQFGRCPSYDHNFPCPHQHTVGKGIRVEITEAPE